MTAAAVTDADLKAKSEAAPARVHLTYLDGLRGLCALSVVLGHAGDGGSQLSAQGSLPARLTFYLFSHSALYAVPIFIVLSGYCLMLPVARSKEGQLPRGVGEFFVRRARRILPPYYAALALSLALIAITAHWRATLPNDWLAQSLPAFTPGVLASHLLLVHNLSEAWIHKIDGPMWSVATEWQIYFVFPPLLLLWRRTGLFVMVIAAFVLGNLPHFLLHKALDSACPWFLGLFALGMAAALINFSPHEPYLTWRRRVAWRGLAAGLYALFIVAFAVKPAQLTYPFYIMDSLFGAATACLLIYCTRHLTDPTPGSRPIALRILEARVPVALGIFSYSLYLIHFPIVFLLLDWMHGQPYAPALKLGLVWLVAIPLIVLLAYGFHLAFERRFMTMYRPRDAGKRSMV
jgi:peptidoglycan/LPS O-acetylase OafA/YrhL